MSTWYTRLGVRPVINASATLTALGGSLMPPVVLEAMAEAAGSFVDLVELQERVGVRLAELTRNEAGYVVSGAAAGIAHAVAACIAGSDPRLVDAFPHLDGVTRDEVIVDAAARSGFYYAARQTGAHLVEVDGFPGLEATLSERTACVLCMAGARSGGGFGRDVGTVRQVVQLASTLGVPVLVDAAAQVPPVSSLWTYTNDAGADAVIVSGGKGLRGPQSSGVVLGRRDLIESCRANGAPAAATIGRPMKVGKEEMVGLLAAVEWYLDGDEAATIEAYEASVRLMVEGVAGRAGVAARRGYPSEAGQPHGRAVIRLEPPAPARDELVRLLWQGEPRIAVGTVDVADDEIALNPQTLRPGEDKVVLGRLLELIG
jgi:uncharacterized pyridoxal phosphate-dependent enzyme